MSDAGVVISRRQVSGRAEGKCSGRHAAAARRWPGSAGARGAAAVGEH